MSCDGVLSYHLAPMTCGVAKFNFALAQQLDVPMLGLFDPRAARLRCPLLSIKLSEFHADDVCPLGELLDARSPGAYRVFFHSFGGTSLELRMAREAERVFCGNSELGACLESLRGDVVELWCPGTLLEVEPLLPTELSVFSFGMAHKVRLDHYLKLKRLLDDTGRTSSLWLSTALHDSTSFDGSFLQLLEDLRGIFAGRLYFLGFLSDRAISHYLRSTTYFAAFFEKGVRANNTSVHAAMLCGAVVITNLDEHAPSGFVHLETVVDIHQAESLPTDERVMRGIRERSGDAARAYGWEPLLARLR